ncbi:MAG TPA: helix-turn-helix transcriptional regulator [Candidatus Merdivicinus intestinavium]|nr:helix-turn-helix transcriptional regulator [Candidatus Merdivicinus intestinavium]
MTEKMRKPIARLLLTYFAVLTIPILISVFAFQSAYQAIENSTRSSMAAALQQTSAALEQRISEIETITYELYQNNELIRFGLETDGMEGTTPSKLLELQHNLPSYSVSNQFIADYYILFPNSEIVLNNKLAYTYEKFFQYYLRYERIPLETWREWGLRDAYPRVLENQPIWMQEQGGGGQKVNGMERQAGVAFLMKSGRSYSSRMYIMILVDEEELRSLVQNNLHSDADYIRISDENGTILFEAGASEAYRDYVLPPAQDGDSFHYVRDENAFITTHYSENLRWNIVSIRPYRDVMSNLTRVGRIIWICIALSFLIGLGIAVLFTVRKNAPVMSLLHDNHALRQRLEAQKPFMQNTFLERLLAGRLENREIETVASYLQIPIMKDCRCAVAHFFDMEHNRERLEQAKLQLSNALEQQAGQGACYCHDIAADKLACVFVEDTKFFGNGAEERWAALIEQAGLKGERCRIAVSLCESRRPFRSVSISVKAALHALDYKDWEQGFQVLRAEDFDADGILTDTKDIFERIAMLENCIRAGAGQKTALTFQAIRQALMTNGSSRECHIFVYTLLDFLGKQGEEAECAEAVQEFEERVPQNSMADNLHHLGKICVTAAENIGRSTELRKQTVFDDIARYIETHYPDQSLSLSLLSEEFGISETYLSQQFKKHFGENLSTYLENVRMKRAEELLLHSRYSINEIAVLVGYNSANTFGKVFNKKYSVSPSAFRSSRASQK